MTQEEDRTGIRIDLRRTLSGGASILLAGVAVLYFNPQRLDDTVLLFLSVALSFYLLTRVVSIERDPETGREKFVIR